MTKTEYRVVYKIDGKLTVSPTFDSLVEAAFCYPDTAKIQFRTVEVLAWIGRADNGVDITTTPDWQDYEPETEKELNND